MKIKVLSLATVYPTAREPTMGSFVRTRLQHMAAVAELLVVAPTAFFNYARPKTSFGGWPARYGRDGAVEIIRPRWIYPPFGGASNAIFLFFQLLLPIHRLRSHFRFQVIDAHFAHPEGVTAALLAAVFRRPFVVTLRGSEQQHGQHWLRRRWMSWALRRASRVITVSERLRQFAIALGVPASRTVTIPNGIDTGVYHPYDRNACRAECGAGPQRLIVSAGHLIEIKGHHHVIQAVRGLLDGGADVMLLIAGGKGRAQDYEPELRREIANLGLAERVQLVGHLEPTSLARLIAAAEVFCLASSREGWPNVVHEALACGTPVVATDVGAVPEMIPSEQYGIVVPSGDVAALENGLRRALSRPWDRDAIAAWGQTRSWQQVASEVLREIEEVLEEARA